MRLKTVLKMVVLFAVTFNWILPAICQIENGADLRSSYERMFEDFVKKTESKARLSNSKSKNLRQTAHISSLKVNYLINQKNILINEMIQRNMPLKSYRIQHFLNDHFFSNYASKPKLDHRFVKVKSGI